MRLVWGTVTLVEESSRDSQTLLVEVDAEAGGGSRSALCYMALSGGCAEGDRVLLNTTAVDMGLGTGGFDLVVARLPAPGAGATRMPGGVALDDPSGGHILKLRYTPLQRDVLAVEEPASTHHGTLSEAADIGGMPVVCCGLHSQVTPVAAAIKEARPDARVAYVMTDEATLAMPMSRLVRACVDVGLLDVTVSAGQSFGGQIEAVNTYSGLLAARHVARADIAIVAIGPGVAGTGTKFGHGGISQGVSLNAVAALSGRGVAVVRMSFAEERGRHQGVSHHTLTSLTRVALARCRVALPALPEEQARTVDAQLEEARVWDLHDRVDVPRAPEQLPDTRGVPMSSMGRSAEDDPAFFCAAAAAGDVAATLLG